MTTTIDASGANGTLAPWGESVGGYYGQTFTAAGSTLTQLQFTIAANSGSTDYEVYLVTWSNSQPQTILWQSPLLTIGSISGPQTVTVSIPNVQLTPGTEYAFILDTSAGTLNGSSSGSFAALDPFSPGYQGGYSGGEFFFSPFETGSIVGPSAPPVFILSDFDLAFTLSFSDFVDSPPVAAADSLAVTEDKTGTGNVLANDSDADAGDQILVTAVSFGTSAGAVGSALNGAYGTLTLNADGSYTYVANSDLLESLSSGTGLHDTFTYGITDSHGATAVSTLTVNVSLAADSVTTGGGNGPDIIYGDQRGLIGAEDTIYGGNGDDQLFGLAGADVLYGQNGNDRLTGGSGPDEFVFAKNGGADVVTDFHSGVDHIVLDGITLKSVQWADVDGNGVPDAILQFSSGSATLLNVATFDPATDIVIMHSSITAHHIVGHALDLI